MKSVLLFFAIVLIFVVVITSSSSSSNNKISAAEQEMEMDQDKANAEKNYIQKAKSNSNHNKNGPALEKIRREFETQLAAEIVDENVRLAKERKKLEQIYRKGDTIVPHHEQRFIEDPIRVLNVKTKEDCKIHCPRCHKWSSMGENCISFGKYPTVAEMYNCSYHYFHPGELKIDPTKRDLLELAIGRFDPSREAIQQKQIFLLAGDNGVGKTYMAHVLSLLNSQYYLRDPQNRNEFDKGDALLEFECGSLSETKFAKAKKFIITNTQAFAQDYYRGLVVVNDIQLCSKELINNVFLPLFRQNGVSSISKNGKSIHRGITFIVTMDMGKVGVTTNLSFNELLLAITKRVVNDFGPELEKLVRIFPFESWDTRTTKWALKRMLDHLPCRMKANVDKISYTRTALDYYLSDVSMTKALVANGRKVVDYFDLTVEQAVATKLASFHRQQEQNKMIDKRDGRGPSWYEAWIAPKKLIVVTIYFIPHYHNEPQITITEEVP